MVRASGKRTGRVAMRLRSECVAGAEVMRATSTSVASNPISAANAGAAIIGEATACSMSARNRSGACLSRPDARQLTPNRTGTAKDVHAVAASTMAGLTCSPLAIPILSREVRQIMENDGHEEEQIYGRANHRLSQAGRCGNAGQGTVPQGRLQRRHLLQVASKVRRHGCVRCQAAEGAGGRKR